MKKNQYIKNLYGMKKYSILSLFIISSCTQVSTNTPNPSTLPTAMPSSIQSTPSTVATSTPTIIPSASNTPDITPSPTTTPVLAPTGSTSDISELTTLNGKIYDDSGATLNDVKVSIKSVDPANTFSSETTTINGSYIFRNVPVGVRLEVTAFKSDTWTKRIQSYVAKSNLQGISSSNVLDFGDPYNIGSIEKINYYFLSNSPEVVEVIPKNQLLKHDEMSFKLVFSEPVNKESVEKNLYIRYVANSFGSNIILGDGNNGTTNTDGPPLIKGNNQIIIDEFVTGKKFVWDTNGFDSFGKELSFSFDGSNGVITDNKNQVRYGITLRKNSNEPRIIDREGNYGLIDGEFFLNPLRGKNIIFNVESDRRAPTLESMVLLKNSTNCIIRLNFSELMVVEGFVNTDFSDLSFYKFYRNGQLIDITGSKVNLITKKGIEILAPNSTFSVGDKIKVEVDPNMKDPAGNFISLGVSLQNFDNIREVQYNP